jgi:hypothetical protein
VGERGLASSRRRQLVGSPRATEAGVVEAVVDDEDGPVREEDAERAKRAARLARASAPGRLSVLEATARRPVMTPSPRR